MDRLATLLRHYSLHTDVFHDGHFCGRMDFEAGHGHLHLLRTGTVTVHSPVHQPLFLEQPALLLYPKATRHTIESDGGAELICAAVDLGAMHGNPLAEALPAVLHISFVEAQGLQATLELLIAESQGSLCGKEAAMGRLCELFLIQLLRYLMAEDRAPVGLLAGLADKRLARALTAMHDRPAEPWTLASLAGQAGMSRARFAEHFRVAVGAPPGDYLAAWRVNLAGSLLRQGKPVAWVADAVGYGSATSLARAFRAHTGLAPLQWLKATTSELA